MRAVKSLRHFHRRETLLAALALPIAGCFMGTSSYAADDVDRPALTQLALLSRCYSQLTRQRLPILHPLRAKVLAGSLTAAEACASLLDLANFEGDTNQVREKIGTADNIDGKNVLKTFYDFYRNWFPSDSYALTELYVQNAESPINYDMHDTTESALHVLRATFAPNGLFSDIVTANDGVDAIRTNRAIAGVGPLSEIPNSKVSFFDGTLKISRDSKNAVTSITPNSFILNSQQALSLSTGELLGVGPIFPERAGFTVQATPGVTAAYEAIPNSVTLNQSHGGGILGTQSYLLLNLGRYNYEYADGAILMPRRWSRAVFRDLLCRPLPNLQSIDVVNHTQDSTIPFRKSTSCMQCHASMDQMGASIRNLYAGYSSRPFAQPENTSVHMFKLPENPSLAKIPNPIAPLAGDPNYGRRRPEGRLYFRSYDGTLIDEPIVGLNGPSGLGAALSKTNDLYVCAARRVFAYFTGIEVDLDNRSNEPNDPNAYYREEVISMGLELKKSNSMKKLIHSVLAHKVYQAPDMRTSNEKIVAGANP